MKKNYKKIISLVLTVLMLMGTVSAIIPLTVSAEGTKITPNTDFVVNGVTYRFDPLSSHTNSTATLNSDGTITLKMEQGDLFWMPGVTIGKDSVLNMRVTRVDGNGSMACGLAYNIHAGTDGIWGESTDGLNVMNIQTNYRTRIGWGLVSKMKSGDLSNEFVARSYFTDTGKDGGAIPATIKTTVENVYNSSKQWKKMLRLK